MASVVRSFVVFRDDDENPSPDLSEEVEVPIAVAPLPSGPLLVYCPDKENINPITGLRASAEQTTKKRKTGILATKLHVPPPSKKHRDAKGLKKRKLGDVILATSATDRPQAEKKSKRGSSLKRTSSSGNGRTRRSPSLPRVIEEAGVEDQNQEQLSQAAVDARCYELTVSPLADLSKAYEQAASPEAEILDTPPESQGQPTDAESEKEQLADTVREPERDASPTPSSPRSTPLSRSSSPSQAVFSTPERKRIYSAFTFSSPSPSSRRYASIRSSSVERFSDLEFEF